MARWKSSLPVWPSPCLSARHLAAQQGPAGGWRSFMQLLAVAADSALRRSDQNRPTHTRESCGRCSHTGTIDTFLPLASLAFEMLGGQHAMVSFLPERMGWLPVWKHDHGLHKDMFLQNMVSVDLITNKRPRIVPYTGGAINFTAAHKRILTIVDPFRISCDAAL